MEAIQKRQRFEREDSYMRAGIVASATINVHRRRGTRAVRPDDFVPKAPREVSRDQFKALLSGWAQQNNAKVSKEKTTT